MLRTTANLDPAVCGEIDALGAIESQIEPRVITVRVRQNEFARKLHHLVKSNAFVGELAGRGEE
jgi:hypothetical protein